MRIKTMLILLIITVNSIRAQSEETWNYYNASNSGLTNNNITVISIDSNEVKWIGTTDGLFRFDGTEWQNFNNLNSGISGNNIRDIAFDKYNNVWIATGFTGLSKYSEGNWETFTEFNSDIPDEQLWDLAINNDTVWVATMSGLARLSGTAWEVFNTENSGMPSDFVRVVKIDPNNSIWAATLGLGIGILDRDMWSLISTDNSLLPSNFVREIVFQSSGDIWIATNVGGIINISDGEWSIYNKDNSPLPTNHYTRMISIGNTLWIGTNTQGLALFDGLTWQFINSGNSGLPSDLIRALIRDKTGNIWIGTQDEGIAVLIEDGIFTELPKEDEKPINEFDIGPNYPNPFNPETRIKYRLEKSANVRIEIFNSLGQRVKLYDKGVLAAGLYAQLWDGTNHSGETMPSGTYIFRFHIGNNVHSGKMLLIK